MRAMLPEMTFAVVLLPLASALFMPLFRVIHPRKPLMGSIVLAASSFLISFLVLFVVAELQPQTGVLWTKAGVGFFMDLLAASLLVIISVVILQTILYSPRSWSLKDGFVHFVLFGMCSLFLTVLILTDSIWLFLLLWCGLDIGWFLGVAVDTTVQNRWRWRRFLFLQLLNLPLVFSLVLLALWASSIRFSALLLYAEVLDPKRLTWALALLFTAVGSKSAAFPSSFWIHNAETTRNPLLQFPMILGITSVLPGLYLLTRLYPMYDHALVPIPVIMASAVSLGFIVFSHMEPFPPPSDQSENRPCSG